MYSTFHQSSTCRQSCKRRAFTLLELMVVVALIGVLVTIVIVRIQLSTDTAKEKTCFHNRMLINSALERYWVEKSVLVTAISDIDTSEYFPDTIPTCAFTGSVYALNTTTYRVEGHTTLGADPGDH